MTTTPGSAHAEGPEHFHRFLLLGRKKLFFYHLAQYDPKSGHDYQAVFGFTLRDDGELKARYLEDLAKNENKRVFHSLRCTHRFELPELRNGKEFTVHLERVVVQENGSRTFQTMTTTETTVECRKEDVLSFRKLGGRPYPGHLTYLVFGAGDEVHLAHHLAARPNWDEAVTITTSETIDPAALQKLPTLVIGSIRDAHGTLVESPLKNGQQFQGRLRGTGRTVDFTVGRQGWWNHTSLNN